MDTVPGYGKLSGGVQEGRWLMTSVTYRVTGMTCEHCVRAVSGELRALDGVSDVTAVLVPGGASAVTVPATGRWHGRPSRTPSTKPATTSSPGS
jgi:cation transport ATPase